MDKGENIKMGSGEQNSRWSVFYGVKVILAMPEALMAGIDTATSKLEYAPATARLESPSSSSSVLKNKSSDLSPRPQYDAQLAGEAYRAGCAALAAGKLDEALYSLNISLSKFPPDKTNAVAKLQSLSAPASQQLHKSPI
ncbi:hypothetical protein CFP56_005690 [Quercus suber]|uniref:Uncharacterized protein n=1 Tax=Quercus suber TaxID=58331 RepID=A0AAW0L8I1_QUESU|nr:hypothetical protein CFP56_17693 [Quercus suber]